MIVEYVNDMGIIIHTEVVEDHQYLQVLLATLNSQGKINLRWPDTDEYFNGRFVEAVFDVEINEEGKRTDTRIMLYFDQIIES
ncbi:hypothetical protein ACFOQM_07135 [Paenibacillus sp. GCM10012307]|uniref:Uncharacterized protein n=1 Tax=Paenibacillus roseus TaxID=2798579 RepID=A0A934J5B6_9BACL|nr:hypothetical protein [Paenibacillus roseus]MBJ6361071.1 hypothetical protein [Paenibacillus roseus]